MVVFSKKKKNGAEITGYPKRKKKGKPYTIHEINSNLIVGINVKHKTIKPLENNTAENRGSFGFGDGFLDTTAKIQSMKEKKLISWSLLKPSALWKTLLGEWKDEQQTERKSL